MENLYHMNTFLPYYDPYKTARCLDYKRLGKQRVEARQIIDILTGVKPHSRWRNHPAVRMWRGYEACLMRYFDVISHEWVDRGYIHNMGFFYSTRYPMIPKFPHWMSDYRLRTSHRSNLLRKNPIYYRRFGWNVPDNLPYFWPV